MALPASQGSGLGGKYEPELSETEDDNLWASLLKEVAANKGTSLPRKSLLVLGDRDSGKTTLLAKLQGNEDPKKGSGLEFGYIEVRAEEDEEENEDLTLLNHWVLDGDLAHTNLLRFSLTEETVKETTVMICASLATPWDVKDQLEKWVKVLHDHLDSLHLTGHQVAQYRAAKQNRWDSYVEPGLDFLPGKFGIGSGPTSLGSPTTHQTPFPLTDLSPTEEAHGEDWEGVLTQNLGLDLVVVLTKTDAMTGLEAEHGLTDQHFDFIQQAARRFCLQYGASLFYTSVKEDKNCDLLYKYLVHQNYGLVPFTTPALVVERDALFIPAGWDSPNKVSILHENLFNFSPYQPWSEVIKSPYMKQTQSKQHKAKNMEVVAEKEQDFLARIAPFLMADSLQSQAELSRALVAGSRLGPAESVLKTPERRVVGSPGVHSALKRSEFGGVSANSKIAANDGAISNFFHALLNKKTATGLGTPPTAGLAPGTSSLLGTGYLEGTDLSSMTNNSLDTNGQTVLGKEGDQGLVNQIHPPGENQIRS